jgi:hypothetical protein
MMAASGIGKRLIARRLNEEKVPTFGKASNWGQSYVQKILLTAPRWVNISRTRVDRVAVNQKANYARTFKT